MLKGSSSKLSIDYIKPNGNDLNQVGLTALAQKCKNLEKVCSTKQGIYGFIPLSPLPSRISDKSTESNLDYLDMHKRLNNDGRKNFLGLQLPVHQN